MPSAPTAADATKKKPEHPRDMAREAIETIVFVVVLVLLLKLFVTEAFVIPTGSMAETLYGYQKIVTCPKCDQVHHRECWSEVGGCGTYGCEQAPAIDKSEAAPQTPMSAWGDTKTCPVCGEEIKSIAVRCRYCNTDFNTADPLTLKDLHRQADQGDTLKKLKQTTLTVFVVSILIPCVAPLTGIAGAAYFLPKRDQLQKCGPLHQVMAFASLIVSAIYTLLLLIFVAYEMAH